METRRRKTGLPLGSRTQRSALCALVLAGLVAALPSHATPAMADAGTVTRPVPSLRSAGRFFLDELELKLRGRWAKAWQSLYPLHQRIAPREVFTRCEQATPFPARLEAIRVVRVRAVLVRAAGLPRHLPGAAVTVAVELGWYGPRDPITFAHTFHLVPVEGHWTWLLSPQRYRLYRQGACGVNSS